MRSVLRVFFAGCLAVLGAGLASAQGPFNFNLLLTANGQAYTITNNYALTINAQVGTQTQVTITATYTGTTAATITTPPSGWLLGSTEFTAALVSTTTGSTTLPLVLGPGQSFIFTITYAPTTASAAGAQLDIPYTEPGTNTTTVPNAILISLTGASPSFTLSYILASANNVVQIAPSGTIPFLPTQLNTTATAELNITNTGSGEGIITGISLSASTVFKLSGVPLFPYGLAANSGSASNLSIGVLYTPTAVENDTGQITITYQGGTTAIVNLTGSGATFAYSYSYLSGTGTTPTPVTPAGTIVLPPANAPTTGTAAATSSVIIQVKNTGSVTGTISSISVSGQGFQLVNPLATPPTLAPGLTFSFSISYTPTQVGTQTGTLAIGSDVFTLSGQGLGPSLTFSYTSSAGTIPVVPPSAVVFSPVQVSQSEKVTFTITNSGTSSTTISNITPTSTSSSNPFTVAAPALPLALAAGQTSQFAITFTPVVVGLASGTLQIDNTSVPLLGSGTAPPTLPSYTITGPGGNVSPASQNNVSLTLANSYPVDLNGVLTLTTSGDFGTDPAVQFSTGSSTGNRTVDFTIPANSTNADFVGQGSQILLQTGTVAETVTLTPSFTTTAGVVLTPASPTTLQFTIASLAPVLQSIQITNETTSGFSVVIVGYSTTRSLSSVNVTFNPATGFNLTTSTFTSDVSQVAALWFDSASSQTFGGLFQLTIPFNLTGTVPTTQTLVNTIASVSATVSNSTGTSNSLQANIQ